MREKAIIATRQLVKRQLTWLRSMPQRHSIDCLRPDAATLVRQAIAGAGEFREKSEKSGV